MYSYLAFGVQSMCDLIFVAHVTMIYISPSYVRFIFPFIVFDNDIIKSYQTLLIIVPNLLSCGYMIDKCLDLFLFFYLPHVVMCVYCMS
jgi:hypothetical protein